MAKSNAVVTHSVEGDVITFTVIGAGQILLDMTRISGFTELTGNFRRFAIHGIVQRVSDRAAMPRNPVTFKPATPQEKFDNMKSLVDFLETGTENWSPMRTGKSAEALLSELSSENLIAKLTPEQLEAIAAHMAQVMANREG